MCVHVEIVFEPSQELLKLGCFCYEKAEWIRNIWSLCGVPNPLIWSQWGLELPPHGDCYTRELKWVSPTWCLLQPKKLSIGGLKNKREHGKIKVRKRVLKLVHVLQIQNVIPIFRSEKSSRQLIFKQNTQIFTRFSRYFVLMETQLGNKVLSTNQEPQGYRGELVCVLRISDIVRWFLGILRDLIFHRNAWIFSDRGGC